MSMIETLKWPGTEPQLMTITTINNHLLFDFIHLLFMTNMSVITTMNKDNSNNSNLNIKRMKREATV